MDPVFINAYSLDRFDGALLQPDFALVEWSQLY